MEFLQILWAVEHELQAASKRMRARLGVTGPQRLVLRMLGHNPRLRPGELARLLHDHPSTLTGVLQRLEDRGLITREIDAADRRSTLLHLTATGREVDSVRDGTIEASVGRALARLSPEQLAAAREVLETIVRELEAG
jgi:DNA-binding MarR family transcriptional regulator